MIEPRYLTLRELFTNRVFRIPEYQRFYSWREKQRQDLFSDLEMLAERGGDDHHFMATIVCHRTPEVRAVGTTDYRLFNVVDGQQRLTTVILILKCIHLLLRDTEDESPEKEELGRLLVKRDRNLILLQTNNANDRIFNAFVRDGRTPDRADIETDADRNLAAALRECQNFVIKWREQNGDILSLLSLRASAKTLNSRLQISQ